MLGSAKADPWCTTLVQDCYHEIMPSRTKTAHRRPTSVRQSVTIPARLATEVRRLARERHLTMSRALVSLAERGVEAELEAKKRLQVA